GAGITFGGGTDPASLEGTVEVYYIDAPWVAGYLFIPSPWHSISGAGVLATFLNPGAPEDGSAVFSAKVKQGSSASLTAKGDGGIDLTSPPGPQGVAEILKIFNFNTGTVTEMCTQYSVLAGSTVAYKNTPLGQSLRMLKGIPMTCPTCSDGVKNGHETGVDCGGGTCNRCPSGAGCVNGSDC